MVKNESRIALHRSGIGSTVPGDAEPGKLGTGIAVAFVATIYGVGLANLVFLPIANKIKFTIARRVSEREIVCDGLMGIAQGDNPHIIEARLKGYL